MTRSDAPAPRLQRAVIAVLACLAVAVSAVSLFRLLTLYDYGVDLEIPLRAAQRWIDAAPPYLPKSFAVGAGPDLPYLYPPLFLPFLAPLLAVPRVLLFPAWTALCLVAGGYAARRLGVPLRWLPAVLAWPPFAEGIVGGNVQVLLFAGFVTVLFARPSRPWAPEPADPAAGTRPARDGLVAAVIGAVKVSQLHAWLFVLRHRPRAAVLGLALVAAVAVATLPLVGLDLWIDWAEQAAASGDPAWKPVGEPLSKIVGRPAALVVTALAYLAVLAVPAARGGAWIGVLAVLGAPSLHMFGLLFLVPAMLAIRREVALAGALLIATYTDVGLVVGAALVIVAFAASARVPLLVAPRPAPLPAS